MNVAGKKRFKISISEISFKEIIAGSIHRLRNLDNAHRLDVKITVEGYLPFYNDTEQLQIIFNNMISNAVKFQHLHEAKPSLNIHVEVDGEKAMIFIRDNGIGISKEALPRIFDMFYRIPGSRADGAGLGLFMVKEIIKKLKGKITVESKVNEGTIFTIELPNRIDPDLLRKMNKLIQNTK